MRYTPARYNSVVSPNYRLLFAASLRMHKQLSARMLQKPIHQGRTRISIIPGIMPAENIVVPGIIRADRISRLPLHFSADFFQILERPAGFRHRDCFVEIIMDKIDRRILSASRSTRGIAQNSAPDSAYRWQPRQRERRAGRHPEGPNPPIEFRQIHPFASIG